jgi:xanthine/uracil permease
MTEEKYKKVLKSYEISTGLFIAMFSLCTTFTILNYTHYWLMGSGMFLGAIIGITIDRIDWIKKNEFYK